MRYSHLLFSIPVFFIAACSSPLPPADEIKTEPIIIKEDFAQVLDANFRGKLSFKDNDAIFTACETDQSFPIKTNISLIDIYKQISHKESLPVYIEFTGEIIFPSLKTDALIRIDHVHHMALTKNSLQCAKPVHLFQFKAKGEAPYWRLDMNNQKLFFAIKASNQAYQVQSGNFQTTQINQIESINEQGQRLNLTIKPGHCYNQKNSEYWGYSATVDSIWGEFSGCGEPGWASIDQQVSGYYLNKNDLKTSDLTLNENYTVEYKEQIGLDTLIRTGFWKSNSPDRIVVMLMKQDHKNIREELVFKRQGLTLTTQKINKNNVVTAFSAPGLIFNKMSGPIVTKESINRIDRELLAQRITPNAQIDSELQQVLKQYFKDHRSDPKNTQFNSVKYDLNGDGIDEAIVLLDWCSKSGCEMLIFKGTEKGYLFSSRVSRIEAPIIIAKTQHYLWQSLIVEKKSQWLSLNFDGISYPTDTLKLNQVEDLEAKNTGVILFADGKPKHWFPIEE